MKIGDLVRYNPDGDIGIIVKVNERDLSFYKSHTYLVQFFPDRQQWRQDFEMEVIA